jgi:hypothetical protein
MKKTFRSIAALLLALVFVNALISCDLFAEKDLWADATYTEDMTFGEGATTVVVEVKVQDKKVAFTLNTDKTTVADALLEHGLIAGDEGEYGLYVKVVNGITADYDVDASYWLLYIDGSYAMTGVDSTEITAGTVYTLEYTK